MIRTLIHPSDNYILTQYVSFSAKTFSYTPNRWQAVCRICGLIENWTIIKASRSVVHSAPISCSAFDSPSHVLQYTTHGCYAWSWKFTRRHYSTHSTPDGFPVAHSWIIRFSVPQLSWVGQQGCWLLIITGTIAMILSCCSLGRCKDHEL